MQLSRLSGADGATVPADQSQQFYAAKDSLKEYAITMDIFREENWEKWERGDCFPANLVRLDSEKDRMLLMWLAVHGRDRIRKYARHKLGISGDPEVPVNIDDDRDDQYFPYLVLKEQVMRESDYWVLKEAAFHAPKPMARFAFCRLTGCSWIPPECGAYSYRTYSCGLKRNVTREEIEDLCREMIERQGPFPLNAQRWLKELLGITDEELTAKASARTERSFDNEPEEWFRKQMRPRKGYTEEENLELIICGIFDACIMLLYAKEFPGGSAILRQEAMEDSFSDNIRNRFEYEKKPKGDVIGIIRETLSLGGRLTPELTPDKISKTAWSVCSNSPQHSYFLFLAYWYGFETDENDDLALKMLADAADRGHVRSFKDLVEIYASGKYVHKNVRLALNWKEKEVELCRKRYAERVNTGDALKDYEKSLRELGDLLMKEGYAKRAKQQYKKADQLAEKANIKYR